MYQYFYRKENQQFGPFNKEELQKENIQEDSYVWYYGLENWTQAKDIPHLADLFSNKNTLNQENNTSVVTPLAFTKEKEDIEEEVNVFKENDTKFKVTNINTNIKEQASQDKNAMPKNWILESILIILLCCMPLAIISIFYGSKVDSLYFARKFEQAQEYSKKAEKWFYTAIIVNISLIFIVFMYYYINL
ncbi:MAG TPA: CD225/dispanin family protein [Chitinophagaceae bacterium]|nr:CD225/dispanin family protein [Chitinophagaceae bacterium]